MLPLWEEQFLPFDWLLEQGRLSDNLRFIPIEMMTALTQDDDQDAA